MRLIVSILALALLSACASDTTRYRVGTGDGPLQPRAEAERTHATRPSSGGENLNLDKPLKIVFSPFPEYPRGLRNDNFVGPVRLRFFVEPDGTVSNPSVVGSPSPALAALCLHAIMRWRFEPPTRAGKPVRVPATQEFVFSLQ